MYSSASHVECCFTVAQRQARLSGQAPRPSVLIELFRRPGVCILGFVTCAARFSFKMETKEHTVRSHERLALLLYSGSS